VAARYPFLTQVTDSDCRKIFNRIACRVSINIIPTTADQALHNYTTGRCNRRGHSTERCRVGREKFFEIRKMDGVERCYE